MNKDVLKDSVEILEHILTQPIELENKKKSVSLLEAARIFKDQDPETSDLKELMINFVHYPESTVLLVQELELIQRDLKRS